MAQGRVLEIQPFAVHRAIAYVSSRIGDQLLDPPFVLVNVAASTVYLEKYKEDTVLLGRGQRGTYGSPLWHMRQKRIAQVHRLLCNPNTVEDLVSRPLSTYDTHALKHLRCYYGDCECFCDCDYGDVCVTFVFD